MSLFAYVRPVDDNNHAPHIRRGLLSLANCVWQIRERAKIGDWLIGLTSTTKYKDGARRISYIARVDDILDRAAYWKVYSRFRDAHRGRFDNYYEPRTTYPFFHQNTNPFHTTADSDMGKDMKSRKVLLSRTFRDFGPNTNVRLPVLVGDLTLDSFWNRIDLGLQPPRQRGYRKFPYRVVDLEKLKLDWRFE